MGLGKIWEKMGEEKKETPAMDRATEVLGLPEKVEALDISQKELYDELYKEIDLLKQALRDAKIEIPEEKKEYLKK